MNLYEEVEKLEKLVYFGWDGCEYEEYIDSLISLGRGLCSFGGKDEFALEVAKEINSCIPKIKQIIEDNETDFAANYLTETIFELNRRYGKEKIQFELDEL